MTRIRRAAILPICAVLLVVGYVAALLSEGLHAVAQACGWAVVTLDWWATRPRQH
jgi:hypothetical protein